MLCPPLWLRGEQVPGEPESSEEMSHRDKKKKKGRIKDNIFHSSKVKDEENNKGKIVHLHVLSRCCHAELMKLRA